MPGFFKGADPGKADTRIYRRPNQDPLPISVLIGRPFRIVLILVLLLIIGSTLLRRATYRPPATDSYNLRLVKRNLDTLRIALDQLRLHCERFPSTEEGLVSLVHDPGMKDWNGPYIFELKPDPWGRSLKYVSDTERILLYSTGPDGIDGSADDIRLEVQSSDSPERAPSVFPANLRPR